MRQPHATEFKPVMKHPVPATVLLTGGICLVLLLLFLPTGRWWHLQRLGQVPSDAPYPTDADWSIAPWTTWWGKQLDPKAFWKGRPVWCDDSARMAAHRRGRAYPPIPTHLTNLIAGFPLRSRSQKDYVPGPFSNGIEGGPVIPLHSTDAEQAYWTWFWMTKPKPPEVMEREQFDVARRILDGRRPLVIRGEDLRREANSSRHRSEMEASEKTQAGLPAEALSEDALLWSYVMKQRQEYASLQRAFGSHIPASVSERWAVDGRLITNDLSEVQVSASKFWKIAYLQRMCREKLDQSYIQAYLKAWNLSSTEVFHESQPN